MKENCWSSIEKFKRREWKQDWKIESHPHGDFYAWRRNEHGKWWYVQDNQLYPEGALWVQEEGCWSSQRHRAYDLERSAWKLKEKT